MSTVRQVYLYLVNAISLQAVAWAVIALLRNLMITGLDPETSALAFQIAVIIIGLPVFLVHWLWAERLARKEVEERGAVFRRLYLYGMLAGFLGPFLANAYDMVGVLLRASGPQSRLPRGLDLGEAFVVHLIPLVILGGFWFYHKQVLSSDQRAVPDRDTSATIRRLYVLGFSAAGLVLTANGIIQLIRWLMFQLSTQPARSIGLTASLQDEITRLLIGVPLWVVFWRWSNRLFESSDESERESALRMFYLYGAVFVGAMSATIYAATILAGLFRRLFDLRSLGDIRAVLPVVIGMGLVWAYHGFVLRQDAASYGDVTLQTGQSGGVRRLYLYLIAFVGLSALLVGLGGVISVMLRILGASFGTSLKEQLAWFLSAAIAGLPVWIVPWRSLQLQTTAPGAEGAEARGSIVRKIYLYFFLFVATMTILSGAVFIVFRLLGALLGESPPTLNELGHAIAFSLIAVGVWLYHGYSLRWDTQATKTEQREVLEALRVAIVDLEAGEFSQNLIAALKQELPELALDPITLPPAPEELDQQTTQSLNQAGMIVGPWRIIVPGESVSAQTAQVITGSPARKLLAPSFSEGWDWAGIPRFSSNERVKQTAYAMKQILEGEMVKPRRSIGVGTVIGILVGIFFLLILLSTLADFLFRIF